MKSFINTFYRLFVLATGAGAGLCFGQTMTNLDLSTRWAGRPPDHQTVTSVAQWLQNPQEVQLEVAVTNLYADTNSYLEIDLGSQKLNFHGAGVDNLGNYIPTNYPSVEVDASLRRQYTMNMVCPNSGPNGSPQFLLGDISDAYDFGQLLSTSGPLAAVSAFLWNNFTSPAQYAITNDDPSTDPGCPVAQTNLVEQLNQVITSGSIYDPTRFSGVSLGSDTTALLAQNPQGQQLVLLNRMLLRDAYGLPMPSRPDFSGTAQVTLFVNPPPQLTINPYNPAPTYAVEVNGPNSSLQSDGSTEVNLQNPGSGNVSTNYSTLQISSSKFGHYGVGSGCDDPTIPPGTANWMQMGPGCTKDTNAISLQWMVSLGRTFDGLAAGDLAIFDTGLSSESYTPDALYYNGSMTNLYTIITLGSLQGTTNFDTSVILVTTNVCTLVTNGAAGQVYTNSNTLLRQVKAYQTFVDILSPNTNETVLNFYLSSQVGTNEDTNGLFTSITGSPYVTWTLQNPNPGSATGLNVVESRNGTSITQSLAEAASAGGMTWTLTQGSGSATRVETRQVTFAGLPTTNRIELDTISYGGSSHPAYQCYETYNFYPWGSELVQTRIPNNPDYVTTYQYYTATDGSDPDDPYNFGYSQLKSTVYPDGYWELRQYGVVDPFDIYALIPMIIFHPYIDATAGGITSLGSGPPDPSTCSMTVYDNSWWDWGAGPDSGVYVDLTDTGDYVTYDQNLNEPVTGQESGTGVMDEGFLMPEGDLRGAWNGNAVAGGLDTPPNVTYDYADDAPVGLAGHEYSHYYNGLLNCSQQFDYYDYGTFDPMGNAFTYNTTNHIFIIGGITNAELPDFRQTSVAELDGGPSDPEGYSGVDSYAQDVSTIDGHAWQVSSYLQANKSTKSTRVYQTGDLVQTETYVYTGSSDGEVGVIYTDGVEPRWAMLTKLRYYCDSLGHPTNIVSLDPVSGQTRTLYTANYRSAGADGELLLSETDPAGKMTSYTYDALQRIVSETVTGYGSQPNLTTNFVYDANGNVLSQTTTAGTLSQGQSWAYDLVGRVTNCVDASGIAMQIAYSADNLTQTSILPGGITIAQQQYVDGQPKSLTGNGCVSQFYTHSAVLFYNPSFGDGYGFPDRGDETGSAGAVQFTYLGYTNSPRWTASAPDFWGHQNAWIEKPAGAATTNVIWAVTNYNIDNSQIPYVAQGSAGIPTVSFETDWYGNPDFTSSSASDVASGPRENWVQQQFTQIGGAWYQATTNWVYLTDGVETPTVSSIHLEQVNGFTGVQSACTIDCDADTNETIATTTLTRAQDESTVTTTEPATSSLSAVKVYQNGLLISSSTLSVPDSTLYYYDALGRTNQVKDPLGFSSYMTYDPNTSWLTSVTDPAGNTTLYTYYGTNEANAGKVKYQTDPNGKNTYLAFTTAGQLYRTWGDVPYPQEYFYNAYGDLTNLVTFRGGSSWNSTTWPSSPGAGDNTYWQYDEASGALLNKIDAQGRATSYLYDTNTAKLATRSWARTVGGSRVTVTNYYNGFGDLTGQFYDDGTPSVYFNNYNRVGAPREVADASGTNELTYDYANRLIATYCARGALAGITVSNHFNPSLGRDSVSVSGLASSLQDNYGYDSYGRLGSVSSGSCSAIYSYLPNSDLLQNTAFKNGSTTVLTTTRSWQFGYRLASIANMANSATVTSHAYTYDSDNRRIRAQLEDGSVWNYNYNDRNELAGASRKWGDGTLVSGQQYGYAYDNIGNRQTATYGGDTNGLNLQTVGYSANSLNQYTNIVNPGVVDIAGVAYTINNVTVNGGLADRKWQYFHRQISVANTNQPVWQNVTNISGTFTNQGGLVFPANSQALVYDADGNISSDGIWSYQWDGENRLASMTMTNVSGIANSNRLQLQFVYDYQGRRIAKIASSWNGSGFSPQSTNYLVYDDWNLVAVINPQLTIQQSFAWGNDLSGTAFQDGGVGGLLLATFAGVNCFPAYDGNGNITALINAADMSTAARYEYSPYGELIRANGLYARQNPFRFSTKFWDDESGLIFYNYRFYSPRLGRWISRDPGWEKDNVNLYGFVHNHPTMGIDRNGKDSDEPDMTPYEIAEYLEYCQMLLEVIEDPELGPLGVILDLANPFQLAPSFMVKYVLTAEMQESAFMKNAFNIIVGRINTQQEASVMMGVAVGSIAAEINNAGGDGDDFILDAALEAAGTTGVDSSETIYGVATDVEDGN